MSPTGNKIIGHNYKIKSHSFTLLKLSFLNGKVKTILLLPIKYLSASYMTKEEAVLRFDLCIVLYMRNPIALLF
jgi:hypothetical protein